MEQVLCNITTVCVNGTTCEFNVLILSERTAHCPDFIDKDAWPPNRPDVNPLSCLGPDAGQIQPSESTTAENPRSEESASDMIWEPDELPQEAIIKQESCAIAKMTPQCALYMGALKIFGTP